MYLNITKRDANIIQVALDHLFEEHTDVLSDALIIGDAPQVRESYHIQRVIEDLQEEIKHQLQHEENIKK
jgi:ribosomal protein S12